MNKITIRPHEQLYKQAAPAGMFQLMFPYYTMSKPMLRYLSVHFGEMWALYKEGYFQVMYYESELGRVAEAVLERCKNGLPVEWLERWAELKEELPKASRKLVGVDMEALSLGELTALYQEIFSIDEDMWAVSIFIDAFDSGFDRKEMERIAALYGFTEEEITVLVTPKEPSFVTSWEQALQKYRSGLLSREELVRDFFWYGVNYSDVEEVTDAFIERELKNIHFEFASSYDEEQEILARHALSENPLELFRTLSVWRDDRKYLNYVGLYGLVKIQREMLRRKGIANTYANALLPDQIEEMLSGSLTGKDVESRWKEGIFVHLKADGEFEYAYGKEAQDNWSIVANALTERTKEFGSEIKGITASKGKVRGIVRVSLHFNDTHATDFKEGEILVTSMTRPEFLPLMKLSGGIVTDEGGITSHAAIVSRELRKPCIIGTKNASEILKSGDLVEVDADNGIVRILERANV